MTDFVSTAVVPGGDHAVDHREIRDLLENWVVFRDAGD